MIRFHPRKRGGIRKHTLRVGESDGKGDGLGLALGNVGGGVPDPRSVRADVGRELHLGDDVVVGADLEGLVTTHHQARLAVLLVLEKTNIAGTALLPLRGVLDKLEKLGAHLEDLLLRLLVGLGLDLFGKPDDGVEVDILGLGRLILLDAKNQTSQQQMIKKPPSVGNGGLDEPGSYAHTSSALAAAASRWALALPETSPLSSSSFFSFFAPPPNMENTAEEVTEGA